MAKWVGRGTYDDGCVAVGVSVLELLADGEEAVVVVPRIKGPGWNVVGVSLSGLQEFDPSDIDETED